MKRTDFTQNFPGGIIKGDSRCREGEEMEEKINLNVCYRKAFEALGAKIEITEDYVYAHAPEGLKGTQIYLDFPSVGATENVIMAASMAKGKTVIENAAEEPEIVDLATFLNAMGANIKGAGTDVIRIKGVNRLHGCTYSIIPDQIEAGTFMMAAAATRGDIVIKDVIPKKKNTKKDIIVPSEKKIEKK